MSSQSEWLIRISENANRLCIRSFDVKKLEIPHRFWFFKSRFAKNPTIVFHEFFWWFLKVCLSTGGLQCVYLSPSSFAPILFLHFSFHPPPSMNETCREKRKNSNVSYPKIGTFPLFYWKFVFHYAFFPFLVSLIRWKI